MQWKIVLAAKIFYPYLYGRRFTVFTDHEKKWSILLQECDIATGHRSGRMNMQDGHALPSVVKPYCTVSLWEDAGTRKDEHCQWVRRTLAKKGGRSSNSYGCIVALAIYSWLPNVITIHTLKFRWKTVTKK